MAYQNLNISFPSFPSFSSRCARYVPFPSLHPCPSPAAITAVTPEDSEHSSSTAASAHFRISPHLPPLSLSPSKSPILLKSFQLSRYAVLPSIIIKGSLPFPSPFPFPRLVIFHVLKRRKRKNPITSAVVFPFSHHTSILSFSFHSMHTRTPSSSYLSEPRANSIMRSLLSFTIVRFCFHSVPVVLLHHSFVTYQNAASHQTRLFLCATPFVVRERF